MISVSIACILIAVALAVGLALGEWKGRRSGRRLFERRIDTQYDLIGQWMVALCKVTSTRPFEGLGLRKSDLQDLRKIEKSTGNGSDDGDAWWADVQKLVQRKLHEYEQQQAALTQLVYPGPEIA